MSNASIIIPAYNAGAYIAEAVGSALSQTHGEKELIVVDDGSNDNTREVVAPYARDGGIRYFYQDNNGPSAARNTGLACANGRLITFLDADDILAPEYLESVGAFLDECPEVDFVFTNYEVFDDRGVSHGPGVDRWKVFREIPHTGAGEDRRLFTGSLTKYIIKHGGFMTTSCVAVRKRALGGRHAFREGFFYGEDDEFFARINYTCKAGYIDRVLMRKRRHAGSLTHDRGKLLRNILHFLKLAEIQKAYYSRDPEIQAILRKKIPALVFDYCWGLIEQRRCAEAQKVLLAYLKQYKRAFFLYKLLLKSYLY